MRRYSDGLVLLQFGGMYVCLAAYARPLRCSGAHCSPVLCRLCWSHEHKDSCCCFCVFEAVSVSVEFAAAVVLLEGGRLAFAAKQADPVTLRECVRVMPDT